MPALNSRESAPSGAAGLSNYIERGWVSRAGSNANDKTLPPLVMPARSTRTIFYPSSNEVTPKISSSGRGTGSGVV
jgi:hypothetical protein